MKKSVFCILTAAVMVLLLLPAPVRACEHFGPDANPNSLKLTGFKMPTQDEDGYSGDYICPECGAVVIYGHILQALSGSLVQEQEIPHEPDKPEEHEKPDEAEQPAKPEEPAGPDKEKVSVKPQKTAKPKATAKPKKTEKPKATATPKATAKPKTGGKSGNKASGTKGRSWEPFSALYPHRRVRMHPQKGIRAEAAGVLVWPVPASPFQSLLDQESSGERP